MAVGFLDNGSPVDPLPSDPFFLGEPLDNAFVFVSLRIPGAPNKFLDEAIVGTVASMRVVPEPASLVLLGLSVVGTIAFGGRRRGVKA